jgi:hypothetical protein
MRSFDNEKTSSDGTNRDCANGWPDECRDLITAKSLPCWLAANSKQRTFSRPFRMHLPLRRQPAARVTGKRQLPALEQPQALQ